MKKIIFLLLIGILFGVASPLFAQSVSGTYKGVRIKVKYVSDPPNDDIREVKCNGEDLAKMVSRLDKLEAQIAEKDKDIKKLEKKIRDLSQGGEQGGGQTNNPNPNVVDSLRRHNNALLEEKWELEGQRNALRDSVQNLEKSVRLLNDSLDKVNKQLADLLKVKPTKNTFSHIGAYYRVGIPWVNNNLLNQKEGSERLWSRQLTGSHQVGLYWNSASFSDELPMTYGVGLEWSQLKFSAGISNLKDEFDTTDIDGDDYTEYLTFNNVSEEATLHYLSIPLTFSIGAPRVDRISGYFQVSLVPSFLLNLKGNPVSASGTYSRAGYYKKIGEGENEEAVDLYLDDFAPLGFVSDKELASEKKEDALLKWRVLLSGRLSGGVYIPLCKIAKGETSPWALKVGVNLDLSFPIADKNGFVASKARYQLDQYNLLSGSGCWYVNPSLEFGILYMFNK